MLCGANTVSNFIWKVMISLFKKKKEEPVKIQDHLLKQLTFAMGDYERAYMARFNKKPSKEKVLAWKDGFLAGYHRRNQ